VRRIHCHVRRPLPRRPFLPSSSRFVRFCVSVCLCVCVSVCLYVICICARLSSVLSPLPTPNSAPHVHIIFILLLLAIWRAVHAMTVLYLLFLVYLLFQVGFSRFHPVRRIDCLLVAALTYDCVRFCCHVRIVCSSHTFLVCCLHALA
jgi:hypothetical protein